MAYVTPYITGICENEFIVYLTPNFKQDLAKGVGGEKINVGFFSASDSDINYGLPTTDDVPDISGDMDECLPKISNCQNPDILVIRNDGDCYSLNDLYSLANRNNVNLNVVSSIRYSLSSNTINYEDYLWFKPSDQKYDSFSRIYGFNSLQEMIFETRKRQVQNLFIPYICGNIPIGFCRNEILSTTTEANLLEFNDTLICGNEYGYNTNTNSISFPQQSEGYLIFDSYYGQNSVNYTITNAQNNVTLVAGADYGSLWFQNYRNVGVVNNEIAYQVASFANTTPYTPSSLPSFKWILYCPTKTVYNCGDTIIVPESDNSSIAFVFSGGTAATDNKRVTINVDVDSDETFYVSSHLSSGRVASSNGFVQDHTQAFNYYGLQNPQGVFIVSVRKRTGQLESGEVVLRVSCTSI